MNPEQPGGPLPPQPNQPQPQADPNQQPTAGPPPQQPAYLPQQQVGVAPQQYQGVPPEHPDHPMHSYEFIMSPQANRRQPLLGGPSKLMRIGLLAGVVVILIIILAVVSSVLNSNRQAPLKPMITIAEDQAELVRVAALAQDQAVDQTVQNVAVNVQYSLTTAEKQTLAYLSSNHIKVGTKQLALKQSSQTTNDLNNAVANNTFDTAFLSAIKADLTTYVSDLQSAYKINTGAKGRQLMSAQFDGAKLLLTMTAEATPSSN